MLSKTLQAALTAQVALELHAQALYLSASSLARSLGMLATDEWLSHEAAQESEHAASVASHIKARGAVFAVPAVGAVDAMADIAAAAQALLAAEQAVTESLTKIQLLAEQEKDRLAYAFVLDLLKEQIEGEDAARSFARMVAAGADLLTTDAAVGMALGK